MDLASAIGAALGTSWASGVNLYAAVATLGLMNRFGGVELPGHLAFCGNWLVLVVAIVMYCVEFFADKIPWLDSVWDAVHTFIRVPAGAALAAAAMADDGSAAQAIGFLLGGVAALTSHGTKAAIRVGINTSPEPVTNIVTSTGEDALVFGLVSLVALHPVVAGLIAAALLGATILLLPKIIRAVRTMLRQVKRLVFGAPASAAAVVEPDSQV
jgi:hypothetical protein